MMPVFKDPEHNAQFDEQGYVVVRGFDRADAISMADNYQAPEDIAGMGWQVSFFSSDIDMRRRLRHWVIERFAGMVARFLGGYRPIMGNFVVKQPGRADAIVPMHYHCTTTDESVAIPLDCFCALSRAGIEDGCLCVVPGSHRLNREIRPFAQEFPYNHLLDYVNRHYTKAIPLEPGEVVFFHTGLWHGSCINHGTKPRVCIVVHCQPEGVADLFYSHDPSRPGTISIHETPIDFLDSYRLGSPVDLPVVGTVPLVVPQLTEGDIDKALVRFRTTPPDFIRQGDLAAVSESPSRNARTYRQSDGFPTLGAGSRQSAGTRSLSAI